MKSRVVVALGVTMVFGSSVLGAGNTDRAATSSTYEELMRQPKRERKSTFAALPPGTQAEIVRTHLARCRDAYRSLLTPEQTALVEEALSAIKADAYDPKSPARESAEKASKGVANRASKVIPQPYYAQIFTLNGTIPRWSVVPADVRDLE